jgi:phage shock protein A
MSEAYDRLDGKDPDADELERQFEEQARREKVQAELAALQAQRATPV